jgi:hypothetical protein
MLGIDERTTRRESELMSKDLLDIPCQLELGSDDDDGQTRGRGWAVQIRPSL